MEIYIPMLLTLAFSIFHFYFERYAHHLQRYDIAFTSFSSGLFVSYIFLFMLPEVFKGINHLGEGIFFIIFWGFIVLHIAEKYVVQHTEQRQKKMERLTHIRTTGFFVNHFVMGIAVIFFFELDRPVLAYLSLIPLLFHMISSSLLVEHLHKHVRGTFIGRITSSGSVFFGALMASMLDVPKPVYFGLFAFITGVLMYVIIRDTLPKYKQGKPILFISGIIFFLLLLAVEMVFG